MFAIISELRKFGDLSEVVAETLNVIEVIWERDKTLRKSNI